MDKIYGPYHRKDGRQHIVIIHDDGCRQTKSYPKHLLEQKIGRELVGDETCDHKDEDFTNDNRSNLQVLTRSENASKSATKAIGLFTCALCNTQFEPSRHQRTARAKEKPGPFCSKSCATKHTHGAVIQNQNRDVTYTR